MSMQPSNNIYALRRTCNEEQGDLPFDDPHVQADLLFEKHGTVILDQAQKPVMEYYYPSTIGMALFFHGGFETGEIAFAKTILSQITAPVIFDIGANIGLHAISWCAALPMATCYAFEPVPTNCTLFGHNIEHNGLRERITIVPAALGSVAGIATFFECDDAAYSSLRDVARRPVISKYDIRVLTVDDFVTNTNITALDMLKIDVEGYENEVLAGAHAAIERFHPHIFVEISSENQNPDVERTIQHLLKAGYHAFVINDGIVTPYRSHDDLFYNYFFIHASRHVEIPQTDSNTARHSVGVQVSILHHQERALNQLRAIIEEKEAAIHLMKVTAEERLDLIRRFETECNRLHNATEERDEKERRLLQLEARLPEHPEAEVTAALVTELRHEAEQKELALAPLRSQLAEQSKALDEQRQAASERLALVERLNAELQAAQVQIPLLLAEADIQSQAAHERRELNDELGKQLRSKIEELAIAVESSAELQRVADERQLVITQLHALAQERLDVIRALNAQVSGNG